MDANGTCTFCLLTERDIMNQETDAKKVFMNEEITLKLGCVRVKNSSKQRLTEQIPTKERYYS